MIVAVLKTKRDFFHQSTSHFLTRSISLSTIIILGILQNFIDLYAFVRLSLFLDSWRKSRNANQLERNCVLTSRSCLMRRVQYASHTMFTAWLVTTHLQKVFLGTINCTQSNRSHSLYFLYFHVDNRPPICDLCSIASSIFMSFGTPFRPTDAAGIQIPFLEPCTVYLWLLFAMLFHAGVTSLISSYLCLISCFLCLSTFFTSKSHLHIGQYHTLFHACRRSSRYGRICTS